MYPSTYFISESVTTIGTGYFHPTGEEAELFTIFYVVLGVTLIISFSTTLVRTVLTDAQDEMSAALHRAWYGSSRPLTDRAVLNYRVALSVCAVFLTLLVGTLFFNGSEGWGALNSLYWCVCLMTTIGYGDMMIKHEGTRVFGIFYIYASVLTFAVTVNNLVEFWLAYLRRKKLREKLTLLTARRFGDDWCRRTLKSSPSSLPLSSSSVPESGENTNRPHTSSHLTFGNIPGVVGKERFILSVLAELGVLSYRRDIAPLAHKFSELDSAQRGFLTHSQLMEFQRSVEQVSRVAQGVAVEYESTYNDALNPLVAESSGGDSQNNRLVPTRNDTAISNFAIEIDEKPKNVSKSPSMPPDHVVVDNRMGFTDAVADSRVIEMVSENHGE